MCAAISPNVHFELYLTHQGQTCSESGLESQTVYMDVALQECLGNVAIKVNINCDDESLDKSLRKSSLSEQKKAIFIFIGSEGLLGACWYQLQLYQQLNNQFNIQLSVV